MLGHDHSLMGGDDTWCGGVSRLFGDLVLCSIVLCACPPNVGIVCVFFALFRLPDVGQGYNDDYSLCYYYSFVCHLPSGLVNL